MENRLYAISQKTLEFSFFALLFFVPLILTPWNYELFEYNKMMLTYGLTVVIVSSWLTKIIINKKINISRTPLDIPLFLFLLSQIISTIFSLDRHVSIFGYYSRFNGGLLSTTSYLILYFAFVSNFPKEKIVKLLKFSLASGLLVTIYGISEHFGIDKNLWVQDVQNRVFSTLGQPNWLAAYLAVLIPISLSLAINPKSEIRNPKSFDKLRILSKVEGQSQIPYDKNPKRFENSNFGDSNLFRASNFGFLILTIVFYITLLFTKSRSGFLGVWTALAVFYIMTLLTKDKKINVIKFITVIIIILLSLTFLLGAPVAQINRWTLPELTKTKVTSPSPSPQNFGSTIIDVGITESGKIRNIVWQGAIDVFKHYPLIGSGVETFAFSYYKYRPVEHNMTSEWDFLYNKAHNEYLNYAATTGVFGIGSYLLLIVSFIIWFIKINSKFEYRNSKSFDKLRILSKVEGQSQNPNNQNSKLFEHSNFKLLSLFSASDLGFRILIFGLFSGWLSILVTNFFGFSVVIIQLFFYLIPAISFVITKTEELSTTIVEPRTKNLELRTINIQQKILLVSCLLFSSYLFYTLLRWWRADVYFAQGYRESRSQQFSDAYQNIRKAIILNSDEPLYFDELSLPSAMIGAALFSDKQTTTAAELTKEALAATDVATKISPNNINFWKTKTRVYYALSQIDEQYILKAIHALETALLLSPTDPKIHYNLALMYDQVDKTDQAYQLLEKTKELKKDFRDAYFALGVLYSRDKELEKAKENLNFILERLNPNDEEARKQLEEIK